MKQAVIFISNGTEEIEAVATIDILRRCGVCVDVVSIDNSKNIVCSNKTILVADKTLDKLGNNYFDIFDMVILPGGMPGTTHLLKCKKVVDICSEFINNNKFVCAICAAPIVLGKNNLLKNIHATCYPGFEGDLNGAILTNKSVVQDGNIVTAKGPGVVFEFAWSCAKLLVGSDIVEKIKADMQFSN